MDRILLVVGLGLCQFKFISTLTRFTFSGVTTAGIRVEGFLERTLPC